MQNAEKWNWLLFSKYFDAEVFKNIHINWSSLQQVSWLPWYLAACSCRPPLIWRRYVEASHAVSSHDTSLWWNRYRWAGSYRGWSPHKTGRSKSVGRHTQTQEFRQMETMMLDVESIFGRAAQTDHPQTTWWTPHTKLALTLLAKIRSCDLIGCLQPACWSQSAQVFISLKHIWRVGCYNNRF